MELKSAKCPNCGGKLELNPAIEKGICIYCGSEIIVAEAIARAQVSGIQTEDAARHRAYQKLEDGNFDEADKDFLHIIDLNPTDCEAHYGRLIVALYVAEYYRKLNANLARNLVDYIDALTSAVNSHGKRAVNYAHSDEQKAKYKKQVDIVLAQIDAAQKAVAYSRLSWLQKRSVAAPTLEKIQFID